MPIYHYTATTKNGFGRYCVNHNACSMTPFFRPNLKGGFNRRENHVQNSKDRHEFTRREYHGHRKAMKLFAKDF